MPCFHPIFAEEVILSDGHSEMSGEEFRYLSTLRRLNLRQLVDGEYVLDASRLPVRYRFLKDFTIDDYEKALREGNLSVKRFPCRKCLGCRLDHSHMWADRILMELPYAEQSWFLTLTYDDMYVPEADLVSRSTGEILSRGQTLVKKHVQDFLKRLRFNSGQKFRYFLAGEYGSKTLRPHYHMILFGLSLTEDDLHARPKNFEGDQYWTSDLISKCWHYGYHIVGKVTWESAAYVARYTLKKAKASHETFWQEVSGLEPEFQTMSRKPGLGYQFYVDHEDFFKESYYNMSTPNGGRRVYPSDYFRTLFKRELSSNQSVLFDRGRASTYNAALAAQIKLKLSDKSLSAMTEDAERSLESRLKGLIRDL